MTLHCDGWVKELSVALSNARLTSRPGAETGGFAKSAPVMTGGRSARRRGSRPQLAQCMSGRALQGCFVDLAVMVLHQCIRPLIEAVASGHHGYQRADDLISG
jgi:hypothetical protein